MKSSDLILETKSLAQQVYEYTKHMILSGEIKSGERIAEGRIANHFKISRTPIREAMRRLCEDGLIYLEPRCYAQVASLSHQEAEEIALIRSQLECLAVRLLCEKATQEDCFALERLAKSCVDFAEKEDWGNVFAMDSEFHLEIIKKTGNSTLYNILLKLDAKVQLLRLNICVSHNIILHDIGQHFGIIENIGLHNDKMAVRLMHDHILQHFESIIVISQPD